MFKDSHSSKKRRKENEGGNSEVEQLLIQRFKDQEGFLCSSEVS